MSSLTATKRTIGHTNGVHNIHTLKNLAEDNLGTRVRKRIYAGAAKLPTCLPSNQLVTTVVMNYQTLRLVVCS